MDKDDAVDRASTSEVFVSTMLAQFDPARLVWMEQLLRRHAHLVHTAGSTREARAGSPEMDLVLVQITDDEPSLELCRTVRSRDDTAVIAVSGVDTERERLRVLEAGCDDHLFWDCGPAEVMARIDAVLRWVRPPGGEVPPAVRCGPLFIDTHSREVRLNDETVHLTRKEYDLLYLIASRAGQVTNRAEVLRSIWPGDSRSASRTLDTHVSSLRRKLGRWVCVTVKGYGLRIGTPDEIAETI
jgi:DNA-binding response OmpR family regulator